MNMSLSKHICSDPFITFDNLSIGYMGQPILSGISLSICRTSFTAILGANGSGKSTLLKTLLGLQDPISGYVRIATPGNVPAVFGYVPQAISLDPLYPLTGFDVVLMGVLWTGRARTPSAARRTSFYKGMFARGDGRRVCPKEV